MFRLFSKPIDTRQFGLRIAFMALMCGATSTVFTKYFLDYFSPYTLSAIAQALSAVVIIIFLGIVPEFTKLKALTFQQIAALSVVAVLSSVIAPLFWLNGLNLTTAADATLLDCLLPIFAVIIASLWLKEKISPQQKIGIVIMLIGVMSIGSKGFTEEISLNNGSVYIILSGFCWAFAEVVFKRYLQNMSPELMVLIRNIIGALVLFFIVPHIFNIEHDFTALYDFRIVGLFIIFSLIAIVLAQFLWYKAIELVQISEISALLFIGPLLGVMFATLFLHESLFLYHLYGGVMIISGLVLTVKQFHGYLKLSLFHRKPTISTQNIVRLPS